MYKMARFARVSSDQFVAYSYHTGDMSPLHVMVRSVRDLTAEGHEVPLPRGWDIAALERLSWSLGHYQVEVKLNEIQAVEMAELARTVLDLFRDQLPQDQRAAAEAVVAAVAAGA